MTTVIEVQGLTKQYASRMDRAKWLERPVLPVLPLRRPTPREIIFDRQVRHGPHRSTKEHSRPG
jgi:hypothetical protein